MHSEYSVRDDYKSRNLGSRNGSVRDVSYAEATQKLEEMGLPAEAWLHEVRRFCIQMDVILDEIPDEHVAAARALQAALLDLLDDAGDDDDDDDDSGAREECEPCEPSAPNRSDTPTEAEQIATAFFEEVTEAVGWSTESAPPSPPLAVLRATRNGCAGGLMLLRFELLWIKAGSHFAHAQLRVPLRDIERASASLVKSPFGSRAELLVATKGEQVPVRFACGSALADVEMFSLELATAVAAIPGTAAVTTATTSATTAASTTSAAATSATATAPAGPARRQTKQ
eukprot:7214122-Prymnesium_polylepis.1